MEAEFSVKSVENQHEANSPQKAQIEQRCNGVPTTSTLKLPASTRCMVIIPELRRKIFQLVRDTPVEFWDIKTLLALALCYERCVFATRTWIGVLAKSAETSGRSIARVLEQKTSSGRTKAFIDDYDGVSVIVLLV
ncbi:hypothetical protein F4604DRAFT_1922718 [Suillus subluteus]|nr:hypothetical protein F4604DRAFT_1922718 [Suillus subluteus]